MARRSERPGTAGGETRDLHRRPLVRRPLGVAGGPRNDADPATQRELTAA